MTSETSEPGRAPREAYACLRAGHRRFLAGKPEHAASDEVARNRLARAQAPIAVVLGCSDSRVPPEAVFDQGLGALFVVRVAGNVAAPAQLGSIEFAVARLGTPLVVVLGHSDCGAVAATLEARDGPDDLSPGLQAIVDEIGLCVERARAADGGDGAGLVDRVVRFHVRATCERLHRDSALLAERIASGDLWIVGAEYRLESGAVEFLDDESGE